MIKLENIVKRYGSKIAVDNISLSIEAGEIFGLLGPNGAGKSTTMKMLMGLIKPDRGEIYINSKKIINGSSDIKKVMGFVPQDLAIYESMNAFENVCFFGGLYGISRNELRKNAMNALEFTGLADKAKETVKKFSGGMKRRLNIACAIVHNPSLIIMDEPTVGIDPQSRNHILESVRQLNINGATIIYTTHYMEEVEAICSRIGIIDYGKLIALGSKDELKNSIQNEEKIIIQLATTDMSILPSIKELSGVKTVTADNNLIEISTNKAQLIVQDVLYTISKAGIGIKNISISEPNLENVFLTLTGRNLRD